MTFMSRGISTLEVLASRHIKTRDHIITTLKKIATRFLPILKAATVHYNNETVLDTPNCSLIVDCTVCQVKNQLSTSTTPWLISAGSTSFTA